MVSQTGVFRQRPGNTALSIDAAFVSIEGTEGDGKVIGDFLGKQALCEQAEYLSLTPSQPLPHCLTELGFLWGRCRGYRGTVKLLQGREIGPQRKEGDGEKPHARVGRSVEDGSIAGASEEVARGVEMPEMVFVVAVEHGGADQRHSQEPWSTGKAEVEPPALLLEAEEKIAPEGPSQTSLLLRADGGEQLTFGCGEGKEMPRPTMSTIGGVAFLS